MDNSTIHRLPFSRCKRLSTIHDAIVFKHPEFFTRKHLSIVQNMMAFTARKADHIIAISFSTKRDLLATFSTLKDKDITVIHLAASSIFQTSSTSEIETVVNRYNLPKRYFLSLATQEPRKNLKTLIDAFRIFRNHSAFNDIGLVLVGGKGWLDSGVDISADELKQSNIFCLGFLKDELLPHLYSGALAFVYPSFYEGFGLPVLEAMSCGRPVITSNNSSLTEVAGDAALYIDPRSVESVTTALHQIADDSTLREKLSRESMLKSREFSWEKTAEQTEFVYETLLR